MSHHKQKTLVQQEYYFSHQFSLPIFSNQTGKEINLLLLFKYQPPSSSDRTLSGEDFSLVSEM